MKSTPANGGQVKPSKFTLVPELQARFAQLTAALRQGRLPGFILLTGFNGEDLIGVAHELSAAIVCSCAKHTEGGASGACGQCADCQRVRSGVHDDVMVVAEPEATKTGRRTYKIEDAVGIQEHLLLQGFAGTARVVLLKEAADLSVQAINRLLKTLEEPPPNTYVIMTTTRRRSLPETLRGRASQWGFGVLGDPLTANGLVGSDVSAGLERMLDPALPVGVRLKIAEAVAKQWKGPIGVLTDSIDLVLNRALRGHFGLGAGASWNCDGNGFQHLKMVREGLRVLRQQAVAAKISLNVQLALEAMVVGADECPYGVD